MNSFAVLAAFTQVGDWDQVNCNINRSDGRLVHVMSSSLGSIFAFIAYSGVRQGCPLGPVLLRPPT